MCRLISETAAVPAELITIIQNSQKHLISSRRISRPQRPFSYLCASSAQVAFTSAFPLFQHTGQTNNNVFVTNRESEFCMNEVNN